MTASGSAGAFCAGGALTALSSPDLAGMRNLYRASLRLFDAVRHELATIEADDLTAQRAQAILDVSRAAGKELARLRTEFEGVVGISP